MKDEIQNRPLAEPVCGEKFLEALPSKIELCKRSNAKKGVKKTLRTWLNPLVMVLSAANVSMSGIVNLIHLISQPIGVTNILLGNIGTSVFFNTISLTLNTYSLVNYFREKNLYKKFNYEKTQEAKGKHKVQGICLDILCDILFLTGAVASIVLLGNPIALAVAAPFITLGCIVMVGNIAKSTYHQVQRFKHHLSQFSREEQEELHKEMQKKIDSSRLYGIMVKILPNIIVSAKLYDNEENKAKREEIENFRRMLKGGSNNSSFSKMANDNTGKNNNVSKENGGEKNTKRSSSSEAPSSQLFLDESSITKKEIEKILPSF